jgi:hypothetical protein
MAQAASEGMNCLGLFLCEPAWRKGEVDAGEILRKWEAEYAPVFRELAPEVSARGRTGYVGGLDRLSAMSRQGIDVGSPEQLAALRTTVRSLMIDLGVPLPTLSAADASVCGLHGSTCKMA